MISKLEVRRTLAKYELRLTEEIKKIQDEIETENKYCVTENIRASWYTSTKYSALHARWSTLTEVLGDIQDIRCCELFND